MENIPAKHSFWKKFFIVLGVIFAVFLLLIVIAFAYLAITKPFGMNVIKLPAAIMGGNTNTNTPRNPILSPQQQNFLDTLGVNTQAIQSITPAQEDCAVSKLGQARVEAIKAGASLTTSDYLKAGGCFK